MREVGAGLGAVTHFLLNQELEVVACEKDPAAARYLESLGLGGLTVVCDDFLKVDVAKWRELGVTAVAGNLPFYITSPIIEQIWLNMPFVERALLGLQREVAERLVRGQGSSFAILGAALGEMRVLTRIARTSFYPKPEVDAAWLQWVRKPRVVAVAEFETLLRASFWGKRKKLANALRKNPHRDWLTGVEVGAELAVYLDKRADQLSVDDFLKLARLLRD